MPRHHAAFLKHLHEFFKQVPGYYGEIRDFSVSFSGGKLHLSADWGVGPSLPDKSNPISGIKPNNVEVSSHKSPAKYQRDRVRFMDFKRRKMQEIPPRFRRKNQPESHEETIVPVCPVSDSEQPGISAANESPSVQSGPPAATPPPEQSGTPAADAVPTVRSMDPSAPSQFNNSPGGQNSEKRKTLSPAHSPDFHLPAALVTSHRPVEVQPWFAGCINDVSELPSPTVNGCVPPWFANCLEGVPIPVCDEVPKASPGTASSIGHIDDITEPSGNECKVCDEEPMTAEELAEDREDPFYSQLPKLENNSDAEREFCYNQRCFKDAKFSDLKMCTKCYDIVYCCHGCQRGDWEYHARKCAPDLLLLLEQYECNSDDSDEVSDG